MNLRLQALRAWSPANELTLEGADEIWEFAQDFFDRPKTAYIDLLRGSDEICVLRGTNNRIVGVATTQVTSLLHDGREHRVIYTPTALLDRSVRGKNLIQLMGFSRFSSERRRNPGAQLYWMFTAGTWTSYLLMTRNLAEFWPHPERETPPAQRELMVAAMEKLGQSDLAPDSQVVGRSTPCSYREGVVSEGPEHTANEDIAAYARLNPNQRDGDTLVCMSPLSMKNWASIAATSFKRVLRAKRTAESKVEPAPSSLVAATESGLRVAGIDELR